MTTFCWRWGSGSSSRWLFSGALALLQCVGAALVMSTKRSNVYRAKGAAALLRPGHAVSRSGCVQTGTGASVCCPIRPSFGRCQTEQVELDFYSSGLFPVSLRQRGGRVATSILPVVDRGQPAGIWRTLDPNLRPAGGHRGRLVDTCGEAQRTVLSASVSRSGALAGPRGVASCGTLVHGLCSHGSSSGCGRM
mgnify:CR=1 FL=1|jgi:hypothetical protein